MRKGLFGLFAGLLTTAALSAAPCTPAPTTLCLNSSRFEIDVSWRDSRGRTGVGQAVSITADTGYFWFFSEANIELVIKVLDATSINQKYWVFFGALTSVEFDLTVTDTVTGAVKTYHNPLGQFASVGDTGAFDPSITAPGHEIVSSEGTSTPPASLEAIQMFIEAQAAEAGAAFTPCAENGAALYLADCRFRLEVHWSDSRGRHGAGQPVQLTNDTGYFWFFSEANVELMVKVLDARSVNGKYWVFFGALTNVAYTLNVTDTVSGEVRAYENPPSTFASVGDTSAFRGGNGISVETDPSRSAMGWISAEAGGSLSTTSADGTVLTLVVPPNSLFVDELVTMTPVGTVGSLPFAGGLVAGVDIQPSGIPLVEGATLSIHTPAPLSRSDETPIAWNGAGEDFFLFPPWPTSGDLELRIFHFGGYGVARGTDAERQAQMAHEPVAKGDLHSQQISLPLRDKRGALVETGGSQLKRISSELSTVLDRQYQSLRSQMLAASEPSVVLQLILVTRQWMAQVESEASLETMFPGRTDEIYTLFKDMIVRALRKIHERCKEDPFAIFELQPFVDFVRDQFLDTRFPELAQELDRVFGCLKFKLRFDSTITTSVRGATLTTIHTVLADNLTLDVSRTSSGENQLLGQGPVDHTKIDAGGVPGCSTVSTHTPSTLKVRLVLAPPHRVRLLYDPATPSSSLNINCPGGSQSIENFWSSSYHGLRSPGELGLAGYKYNYRDGWLLTGQQNPWAVKTVGKTLPNPFGVVLAEITIFTLTHTPE